MRRDVPTPLSGSPVQNISPIGRPREQPRAAAKRAPEGMVRGSYYNPRRTLRERIRNWDFRSNAQIDVDDYNTSIASDKKFAENTAANIERLKRAGLSDEEARDRAAKMEQEQRELFGDTARSSNGAGRNTIEQEIWMQNLARQNAQKSLEARAALQKKQMAENRRLEAIDRRNRGINEAGLQATREATAATRARTEAREKAFEAWKAKREEKRRALADDRSKKGFVTPELDTDAKLNILGWEARRAGFGKVTDESMRGRFDAAKKQMQIDHEKGIREGRIDPHTQFNPTDDDVINHMRTNLQGSAKRRERSIAAGEQSKQRSAAEKRAMIKDYGGTIAAETPLPLSGRRVNNSQKMSFAQAEAAARWRKERNADRYGRRNDIGREMDKYTGSMQHGADTVGYLAKDWGGRAASLVPQYTPSQDYLKAYDFRRGYEASMQKMQEAMVQQQQHLAQQSAALLSKTTPNSSPADNLNNAQAMARATTPRMTTVEPIGKSNPNV